MQFNQMPGGQAFAAFNDIVHDAHMSIFYILIFSHSRVGMYKNPLKGLISLSKFPVPFRFFFCLGQDAVLQQ